MYKQNEYRPGKRGRKKKSDNALRRLKLKPGIDAGLKKVFASIGVPEKSAFKPDPFQLEALSAISKADCLVTAPTGAGKTWIAEKAMARTHTNGGRSWYASPLKALSNSKYNEFSKIFGKENVGILTGDRKENPGAPIIVGTTEILRNQLYDSMHSGETLSADLVVLDEAHFLGDKERGVVWEEIMIYLPSRIPLLLLSATIGNANQIAKWLSSIRLKKCIVVEEKKRPVPLYPIFFHPSGKLFPLTVKSSKGKRNRLHKQVSDYLKIKRPPLLAPPYKLPPFGEIMRVLNKYHLLPAIFFLKSRA
ncbi:MAG: DEAD/DEAH box helicase, partial [Deltaproteobacteria bacterium]|nr:DEAD/DEAH box helicase [Deltaproteobacteria bacterium]